MKASEIVVGGHYLAKVNNKIVTVRVDRIDHTFAKCRWYITNLTTGRKTVFRSALKFRSEVTKEHQIQTDHGPMKVAAKTRDEAVKLATDDGHKVLEAEQRPDPLLPSSNSVQRMFDAKDRAAEKASDKPTNASSSSFISEGEHEDPLGIGGPITPAPANQLSPLTQRLKQAVDAAKIEPDSSPHLIVQARAGTGKTTTLIEGLRVLKGLQPRIAPSPQQQAVWDAICLSKGKARSVTFVAFNKAIADELASRVPDGCAAMTMHSLGFRAVQAALGRQQPDQKTTEHLVARILGQDIWDLRKQKGSLLGSVSRLVSLCKQNLVCSRIPKTEDERDRLLFDLDRLAEHHELELNGDRAEVFDLVPQVIQRARSPMGQITFDDMIWLPVALNLPITKVDLLLVDEAQDLNRCQQELAKKVGRRLILVGDDRQAIYGFAGADSESLSRLQRELGAQVHTEFQDRKLEGIAGEPSITLKAGSTTTWQSGEIGAVLAEGSGWQGRGCIILPLTVTRRCGKAIVDEARKLVPDFEAHESNGPGLVSTAPFEDTQYRAAPEPTSKGSYRESVNDGNMILCRVNAVLVSQCFKFLKAGRKATIQGRDVGEGLLASIRKLLKLKSSDRIVGDPSEFLRKLSEWHMNEVQKEQNKKSPSDAKLQSMEDRVSCLQCFCEDVQCMSEVARKIEVIFTDDKDRAGIRLSSIHKAKGLEAERVFLLPLPKKGQRKSEEGVHYTFTWAKGWQRGQEDNLLYVAITRAIKELIYVS